VQRLPAAARFLLAVPPPGASGSPEGALRLLGAPAIMPRELRRVDLTPKE
jgi:hypothetical protein